MEAPSGRTARIPLAEVVRRRIRARAAYLGLTHAAISERFRQLGLNLSRSNVSRTIRGSTRLPLDEVADWAAVLETSEAYLLGFTLEPGPDPDLPAILSALDTPGNLKRRPERASPGPHIDVVRAMPARETAKGGLGERSGRMAPVADLATRREQRRHRPGLRREPAPVPG